MNISPIQKAFFAGLLLTCMAPGAYGRHLSPDEALSRIQNPLGSKKISSANNFDLIHTEESNGEKLVYVFNDGRNGFVVVSADDRMPGLLGYSDAGNFDPENVSPSLKWWLGQYAEEAAAAFEKGYGESKSASTRSDEENDGREIIPTLLSTKWGQQNPYYLDCPEVNGNHCVTGCVATAMSQVIKYHSYPASGLGNHAYRWNGTVLDFDYENTTFEYEGMLDTYEGNEEESARNAVAQLMYACGVSVDMSYRPTESGAYDTYIAYALRKYFNYDEAVRLMMRDFFTLEEWEELIYSELKEKRPVIMGGQAREGGHQFVCDGYDGNGYFHINWGWEGYGDGHFLLSSLNPEYQGVGGYEGGYNSNQSAICGIQPPTGTSARWYPIYSTGYLNVQSLNNGRMNINILSGNLFNYSPDAVDVEILLQAEGQDGSVFISEPTQFTMGNDPEPRTTYPFPGAQGQTIYGYNQFVPFNLPKDMPAGDYKCTLVLKTPEGNIETGIKKFGAMLGDEVEVGCGTVLNPGSVVGSHTNIYPLSSVRGYVPAGSIYKRQGEVVEKY